MESERNKTVSFSSKGQVVIPSWVRKLFEIKAGTKAVLEMTPDGILLKPITRQAIYKLHGVISPEPGSVKFEDEWADHKREERKLEAQ